MAPAIVVFDGFCELCSRSVLFILRRDPHGRFRFASSQGEAGRRLLADRGFPDEGPGTIVLVEEDRVSTRSTAALRIARRLRWPWPLAYGLIVVPRPVRDAVYRLIARTRNRWFGRRTTCMVAPPQWRARFLDEASST